MPSVRKRLETLEKSVLPRPNQAVDHVVVSQALVFRRKSWCPLEMRPQTSGKARFASLQNTN